MEIGASIVSERTYLFSYDDSNPPWGASRTRRTRAFIEAHGQFGGGVHPEVMRRLFALADAVIDADSDFGFGGGTRDFLQQDAEFRRRHFAVPCPGGIIKYDGKCWQRHEWASSYAPPGRSYHENAASPFGALAVDMVGNHGLATPICGDFGLLNGIEGEAWHYQPVEIPRGRSDYKGQDIPTWPLPGEDNNLTHIPLPRSQRAYDSRPTFSRQEVIDDVYREANQDVPRTPLTPEDSPRKVFVGLERAAFVVLTAVGTEQGFVKMAGVDEMPNTSILNVEPDGVTNCGAPVGVPTGHIFLWSSVVCDIVVDVFDRWD